MIKVDIWSDIVCPFCYIGKKRFENALSRFSERENVQVTWRSFELDPNSPKSQKRKIHELLASKYGKTEEWARQMNEGLVQQGKELGLNFAFDRIIPSNSFDAHRLLHLAREEGQQDAMQEMLFSAYFIEGKDIALTPLLHELGLKCGINPAKVEQCLKSDGFTKEVRAEEAEAHALGISGVPAFIFNSKYLVSGAQASEVFLGVLDKLTKEDA